VTVYFHDVTCLPEALSLFGRHPEASGYDRRALLIAGERDHVIVTRAVDPAYLDYLRGLGLGPAPGRVHFCACSIDPESGETHAGALAADADCICRLRDALRADGATEVEIEPYLAHRDMDRFADALGDASLPARTATGSAAVAWRYCRKDEGRALAARLGLPLPAGEVLTGRPTNVAAQVRVRVDQSAPLVAKAIWGSGGSLLWVVERSERLGGLADWLGRQPAHAVVSIVLEEFLVARGAFNAMVRIGPAPGRATLLGITDQRIVGGTAHAGNEYPATTACRELLEAWSHRLAEALQRDGFRGWAGFDFLETTADYQGGPRPYFIEVNPRVNAALFPLEISRRINQGQQAREYPLITSFIHARCHVAVRSWAACLDRLGGSMFEASRGAGVVLFSPDSLQQGVLSYVVLGRSPDQVAAIHQELIARLDVNLNQWNRRIGC
jgi:hypothetical protein